MEHAVRTKDGGQKRIKPYTRGLAIRVMCTECLGFEGNPSTDCTSPLCPLYVYRKRTLCTQKGDK